MSPLYVSALSSLTARTAEKKQELIKIIDLLFSKGARLRADEPNILTAPIYLGNEQLVRMFLQHGASAIRPIRGLSAAVAV